MDQTNINLTPIEKKYTERQFKKIHRSVNWLWFAWLFIILCGIPFLFTELIILGLIFISLGFLGSIYYKKKSVRTKFELQSTSSIHTGVLHSKDIKTGTTTVQRVYCLDDFVLSLPVGLESYMGELEEKYDSAPVKMTLSSMKVKIKDITQTYYTPLVIEHDLCINTAIEKYGTNFSNKETIQIYVQLLSLLLIYILSYGLIMGLFNQFDFGESFVAFVFNIVVSFFISMYVFSKLFDFKKIHENQKNKFKC